MNTNTNNTSDLSPYQIVESYFTEQAKHEHPEFDKHETDNYIIGMMIAYIGGMLSSDILVSLYRERIKIYPPEQQP